MNDSPPDNEALLARFDRLIQELMSGQMRRNRFRQWEIQLLLDIEGCHFLEPSRPEILKRYQRAVHRQMEKGNGLPMKLSEYLKAAHQKSTSPAGIAEDETEGAGTLFAGVRLRRNEEGLLPMVTRRRPEKRKSTA